MKETGRRLHIDALRVLAMMLVLYNHTGERGFTRYETAQGPAQGAYLALAVLDTIAVPLFFMISGALLLGREEPLRACLKKRVLRYVLVLVGASTAIYVYICRTDLSVMNPTDCLRGLYDGRITTSYWFLYAYLGYLLGLPLLRKLARAMTERDFLYITALMGVMNALSALQWLCFEGDFVLNSNLLPFTAVRTVYYPLAGYFLEHRLADRVGQRRLLLALFGAGVLGVALGCLVLTRAYAAYGYWPETAFGLFVFAPALAVFAGMKALSGYVRVPARAARVLAEAGACTFGIYLFEKVFRDVSSRVYSALVPVIGGFAACWVWIACAFLLGMAVTAVLRRLPGLRKLL